MMTDLSALYHPITATPFSPAQRVIEVAPSQALRPYVRCFWREGEACAPTLVVPDTCLDLLFRWDASGGGYSCCFSALYDKPFILPVHAQRVPVSFGVRFYAWSVALFTRASLAGSRDLTLDAEAYFAPLVHEMLHMLQQTPDFVSRCAKAESLLYAHLTAPQPEAAFGNAVYAILQSCGRLRAHELAKDAHLSLRQLERLFQRYSGASPKALSAMVRYQCLWQDALFSSSFCIQDAVYRYGYTDQSHLLRQFRAYHGLPLRQALALAHGNVAFLQDASSPA